MVMTVALTELAAAHSVGTWLSDLPVQDPLRPVNTERGLVALEVTVCSLDTAGMPFSKAQEP